MARYRAIVSVPFEAPDDDSAMEIAARHARSAGEGHVEQVIAYDDPAVSDGIRVVMAEPGFARQFLIVRGEPEAGG
jgi:hypothetical protein